MSIINAVILGLVQGIAEFLPISSSGHLVILQSMFGMSDMENNLFFDVLLHMGTLIAICFMYWSDIVSMVKETLAMLRGERYVVVGERRRPLHGARLFLLICVASLPLFLVLPVNDYVDMLTSKPLFVGIALILTGFILLVADRMEAGTKTERNSRFTDALIIGLCQCVATLPGLSRSGVTITAGIATGHRREYAVKFSLLMSIPAVLGATGLELVDAIRAGINASYIPAYILGMVAAMVSGVFAIKIIKLISKKGSFSGFSYYCWIVGVVTIILTFIF